MRGDERTPEERDRDAEIGRRLQEKLPGYRARFGPDAEPEPDEDDEADPDDDPDPDDEPDDEPDEDAEDEDGDEDQEPDDGDERAPTLFRPLVQEGGCLDPGCWPEFIVVPALLLWHLGRGIAWALGAARRRLRHHRDEWRQARGWEPWTPPSALAGAPLRPPGSWADAQRAFRAAYAVDPDALPRRRVQVERTDVVTVVASDGRTPRSMAFAPVSDAGAPMWDGEVDGVLVGELGTNAAACVEVAGGVLWPAYNPVGR